MYPVYKRTESVPEVAFHYFFKISFIVATFQVFHIKIYFIQYRSSPELL